MQQSKSLAGRSKNQTLYSDKSKLPVLKAKSHAKSTRSSKKQGGDIDTKASTTFTSILAPKAITAKSWVVYHRKSKQVLGTYNFKTKREIASLTKVMTAKCVLQLCSTFNISTQQTYFRVTETAASISGTVAELQQMQWLTIMDLLYGMMLPSGNDSATVLAENLGAILFFKNAGELDQYPQITSLDLTDSEDKLAQYQSHFVAYMNRRAHQNGMKSTQYMNPHGLDQTGHYGNCEDLLRLSNYCLKDKTLREITSSQQYKCKSKQYKNNILYQRQIKWRNTNKCLGNNCFGLKTGFTPRAGGCLITTHHLSKYYHDNLIIIILGCRGQEQRFSDAKRLYRWGLKQLQQMQR